MDDSELVEELKRLGQSIVRDQARRDELIGQLYERQHGIREIARYANLAHTSVRATLIRDGLLKP